MKRIVAITLLLLVCCVAVAQENPAPLAPNYGLIDKVTHRWFGEYRYRSLTKRFDRCDTAMNIDHFRCLYYGAAMRGDTVYSLVVHDRRYHALVDSLGQWHPVTQHAWWRLQMLLSAVWSSGDGSEGHPFHVASLRDAEYMVLEVGLHFVSYCPEGGCIITQEGTALWYALPVYKN